MWQTTTSQTCALLQHSHTLPTQCTFISRKRSASLFAYVAICKNQRITKKKKKTWRPRPKLDPLKKSTQPTLEDSVWLLIQTPGVFGSCHFQSCVASATVYQSTHSRTETHNQQLPKILTAQKCMPTLEELEGRAGWNVLGNKPLKRGETIYYTKADCYQKELNCRVALLSRDVLLRRLLFGEVQHYELSQSAKNQRSLNFSKWSKIYL